MVPMERDEYRERMRQAIEDADVRSRDTHLVKLKASRQDAVDCRMASKQLGSMNPELRAVGKRLEVLAARLTQSLDSEGAS